MNITRFSNTWPNVINWLNIMPNWQLRLLVLTVGLFLFIPADPHDTLNIGGEVETWLGKGDEAEKFKLTRSSAVWVPANVHHNPQYYRQVHAEKSYFMIVIALTKSYFGDKMDWSPITKPFEW